MNSVSVWKPTTDDDVVTAFPELLLAAERRPNLFSSYLEVTPMTGQEKPKARHH
jgi:hypothetical protein